MQHGLPAERLVFPEGSMHASVFIAAGAIVRGDVTMGESSSVWFNAVIRADTESIRVGRRTNIQDLCLLHADPGFPCVVGDEVTVGHRAIVHGAKVGNHVMIGMGAILLNGASVGENTIIGAGALVPEGVEIPSGVLALGMPAKVRRPLEPEEIRHIQYACDHYVEMARRWAAAPPSAERRSGP
jgi:carbonic anhydrase/acetyltransferase-like protein (isoleucine patch superfamily)